MNTTKKIAIALAVLMVVAMAAPATAEYVAENKKMNIYKQGEGDLVYTYGTPFYQCIWNYNEATGTNETATYNINLDSVRVPKNAIEARLYVYWTWSKFDEYDPYSSKDYGIYPELKVEFNGEEVLFNYAPGTNWIEHYTDAKKIAAVGEHKYLPDGTGNPNYVSYNFPAGTNCAMIPIGDVRKRNVVDVTNVYPYYGDDPTTSGDDMAKVCIQGVGLLLTLEDDSKTYWIAEGNDMTYVKWKDGWTYGITPDNATTKVTFGTIPPDMDTATLTTVVPAGGTLYNRLYFNGPYNWDGLWNANPDPNFAVNVTDVSCCLREHNNMARFQNGLWSAPVDTERADRQMNVANAFLVVE